MQYVFVATPPTYDGAEEEHGERRRRRPVCPHDSGEGGGGVAFPADVVVFVAYCNPQCVRRSHHNITPDSIVPENK